MKKLIKIYVLLFFLTSLAFTNGFYNEEDLTNAYNKLKLIKSGDKYIKSIDLIIDKYKENEDILTKLEIRLNEVDKKLEGKTDSRSRDLKTLLDYFNLKVFLALEQISINNGENIDKEENINNTQNEEVVYPGFSSNYNDKIKTILAGEEEFVYAGGVGSLYEKADVGKLVFYITGNNISDFKSSIKQANLYVEGLILQNASNSDIDIISSTKASITFDNINNFILPDDGQINFRLSITPNTIGYQNLGKVMKDLIVSDVDFKDVIGITSDREITSLNIIDFSSEEFSISAVKTQVSLIKDLNTSTQIKINISGDFGENRIQTSNSKPKMEINTLKIQVFGTDAQLATYILNNSDDSSDFINGVYNSGTVEFDLTGLEEKNKYISEGNGEDYTIRITGINTGITAEIPKDGITYNLIGVDNANNINMNLNNSIDLGYRDF